LVSVVVLALMGVLAGSGGPTAIAAWAELNKDRLVGVLDLPHGIPRKDVFRRVLSALKPAAFQACFVNWLQALRSRAAVASGITQPVFAIDGKTLRRSHDRATGLGALHSVSLWATDFGLTLGQVATDEKSNEITAIPELLRLVDVRGAIITIDAMGTQTAIASEIVGGGADFVLALKGNQEKLHNAVVTYVTEQMQTGFTGIGARRLVTSEQSHGRKEQRIVIQMPAPKTLPGFGRWTGLKTIAVVMLMSIRDGRETYASRYFISSLGMGVNRIARAVRSHWSIENACHWSLDITYREDESRIREAALRENFAWLNRFTLSLLKQHTDGHSLAMQRRRCGWNIDVLLEVLNTPMT
jgi:predicted transposase YbfD/YdcC